MFVDNAMFKMVRMADIGTLRNRSLAQEVKYLGYIFDTTTCEGCVQALVKFQVKN